MKTLTIVDTFGFFFRGYYALPKLTNSKGFPTGLLTGFINLINEIKKDYKTQYILFALDSKGETFRHGLDSSYKANRPDAPEDLKKQLPVAIEWINKMGFATCEMSGYEADDIIASAVKFAKTKDVKIRIITHDKDLYQLIEDDKVSIFSPAKKHDINSELCFEKFGVMPNMVRDYLALVGDSADNIAGVKGIGTKGASKLLNEFKNLEGIYANLDKIANVRTRNLLVDGEKSAFLSKELTTLHDELEITKDLEDFTFPEGEPLLKIIDELEEFEFKKIISKINKNSLIKDNLGNNKNNSLNMNNFEHILLDTKEKLFEVVDGLRNIDLVAFDTETTGLDTKKAKIVGFSFAQNEKKGYYVPLSHNYLGVGKQVSLEDAKKAIEKIYTCKLVGQNLKYDFHIIKTNFDLNPPIPHADTMVLAWLLDSSSKLGLDFLAKKFFNYNMKPFKELVARGQDFSSVAIEDACFYAVEDAVLTLKLFFKLKNLLENELFDEYENVDREFLNVLYEMEEEGIRVDGEFLQNLLDSANTKINTLTKEIYRLSESEFNINSTQQLSKILFEKLNLPHGKKTKTGYSTNEEVLNGLINAHEIIPNLLEYREIYKLKSTYLEPLIKLAEDDENSRIYTSFLQTGTSTGRLASKEPNLQNIPVKTPLGREVRKGFVAKDGYKLVGLDYSQIELRLLAHFSQDEDMLKAFREDKDIHQQTAIKIFGEDEASAKRSVAKSINFGLIYGMGARKLADTLKIETKEAKAYMDGYFASFKTIKDFFKQVQSQTRENGFVKTLLGRKRYFNYSLASPLLIANYDRECINTLFQGSAADLIKLAMLKLYSNNKAKLLLQIHDELIFEVKSEYAKEFSLEAKEIMESIYELKVPLKTSVSIGDNWGELK